MEALCRPKPESWVTKSTFLRTRGEAITWPAPRTRRAHSSHEPPYDAAVADLTYLRDQLLQLSVRDALQLVGLMLAESGVQLSGGGSASVDSNDVVLLHTGGHKISVIKVLRELTGLGLKEAKDMAESAPHVVLHGATKQGADAARQKLIEVGATVEIRPAY